MSPSPPPPAAPAPFSGCVFGLRASGLHQANKVWGYMRRRAGSVAHRLPHRPRALCAPTQTVDCVRVQDHFVGLRASQVMDNSNKVGLWGGECTCPDGQMYLVGDNLDLCGSLACAGGDETGHPKKCVQVQRA